MSKLKILFQKYREFIVYVIVGCCTTLINLGIYILCNFLIGEKLYQVSNVIAWIISVTFAFVMNKLVVFVSKSKDPGTVFREALGFYGARLFSLALESGGLWLLIDLLRFKEIRFHFIIDITGSMIAKFIMLVVVTISNYIFSKFVVFRKRGRTADTETSEN